jgi:hypothetical protein
VGRLDPAAVRQLCAQIVPHRCRGDLYNQRCVEAKGLQALRSAAFAPQLNRSAEDSSTRSGHSRAGTKGAGRPLLPPSGSAVLVERTFLCFIGTLR